MRFRAPCFAAALTTKIKTNQLTVLIAAQGELWQFILMAPETSRLSVCVGTERFDCR